jgi:hypothetical protein
MPVRQEVLNVLLAQLLRERGLVATPEQIEKSVPGSREMPDVLVDFQGLRLAIEGEIGERGALKSAAVKARKSALGRVEKGIAHIGVAVVYPPELRTADFATMKHRLANANLQFAIITESQIPIQPGLFPEAPEKHGIVFITGNLDALSEALRRAYDELVQDKVLERAVELLEQGIRSFMSALSTQPATTARCAKALGIRELPKIISARKGEGDLEEENE